MDQVYLMPGYIPDIGFQANEGKTFNNLMPEHYWSVSNGDVKENIDLYVYLLETTFNRDVPMRSDSI